MLPCRRYVFNPELAVSNMLPNEVMTDTNVLAVGSGLRVFGQVYRHLVIFLRRGTPNIVVRGNKAPEIRRENHLAKTVDESVMGFCVLE